jgi:sigma-E factor negative regulatory protein RseA
MNHTRISPEAVSALADGALQGDAFAQALAGLAHDSDARACWSRYQLIGDALRQGDRACGPADPDFVARLQARLAQEPQAPRWAAETRAPDPQARVAPAVVVAVPERRRAAANADGFRWKMVAGFASVAAVAAIGWNVVASGSGAGAVLASAASGVPSATVQRVADDRGVRALASVASQDGAQVMLRDPRLDELLAAHREAGGAAGLQSPGSFVRNASFETAEPGAAER